MPRILIVEDNEDVRRKIVEFLELKKFKTDNTDDGLKALGLTLVNSYDLILLDVMIPGLDGISVCEQLKKRMDSTPIIFLSAKDTVEDRINGLTVGADDYIAKPFSSRVVVARVKAVLRRSGALAGEASGAGAGLTFNGWRLDTTRCELYNPQQQAIPLTQGEYGLLLALAQNARRVLNREQLLALTHNESTEVFDRTIDVLIMRLRRKIELNPHQPTLIKTLRGLGYVFSADVTHSEKAA